MIFQMMEVRGPVKAFPSDGEILVVMRQFRSLDKYFASCRTLEWKSRKQHLRQGEGFF